MNGHLAKPVEIPKKLTHSPRIKTYLFHEFRSILLTRFEIR